MWKNIVLKKNIDKLNNRKLYFIAIGIFNTFIDFGLLFGLRTVGVPVITANIISSTTAFLLSFGLNKKITFKTRGVSVVRELALFTIVTIFGLWVIQTIVITLFISSTKQFFPDESIALLLAKVLATCASLIWNYILYSKIVFKDSKSD